MIALPYISLSLFLFFLYSFGNIKKLFKYESIITTYAIFVVFFGLRGYIFTDVVNYVGFFHRVPSFLADNAETNWLRYSWFELGFTYYVSFFKIFTNNYFVFAFFDTLIDLILFYKALEWFDSNTCLNYIIMIAMMGLPLFVNNMRNIKSILLFVISLRYIYNKNILKYFLICSLAFLFHTTAIIYFPLYFIISRRFSFFVFIAIFIISLFFFFAGKSIIVNIFNLVVSNVSGRYSSLISNYLLNESNMSESRGLSLGLIEKIATFFLALLFFKSMYKEKMIIILNCFLLYFFIYFAFSGFVVVSYRFSGIFTFSYWILWPQFIKSIRTKHIKGFFLICLLTYALLKCSLYSQNVQRYENILFGAMNIEERQRWNNL
jgi:hypothetical protein